jgi:hypothetical protein
LNGEESIGMLRRMRALIAWCSVSLLAVACFAPWTLVTTFRDEQVQFGVMNEYTGGGEVLLVCAVGVALGLLSRRSWLASACAWAALVVTVGVAYGAPGTLLQFGYRAELTWGAFLAFASSVTLVIVGGSVARASRAPRPACGSLRERARKADAR